jgi:hypothetical protein
VHIRIHRTYNEEVCQWFTLTLNPLTFKIWWAPNNASRWQMGFNLAFKGLIMIDYVCTLLCVQWLFTHPAFYFWLQ